MSYIRPRPDYCTFAIDGPTFVRKRGGSYWAPQDELSDLVCVRNGAVVLSCRTEADVQRGKSLLAAAGFIEGQDYGVAMPEIGKVVPCPGLRIEAWWFH